MAAVGKHIKMVTPTGQPALGGRADFAGCGMIDPAQRRFEEIRASIVQFALGQGAGLAAESTDTFEPPDYTGIDLGPGPRQFILARTISQKSP